MAFTRVCNRDVCHPRAAFAVEVLAMKQRLILSAGESVQWVGCVGVTREEYERLIDRDAKLTAVEEIAKEYTMRQRPWITADEYLKRIAALVGVK